MFLNPLAILAIAATNHLEFGSSQPFHGAGVELIMSLLSYNKATVIQFTQKHAKRLTGCSFQSTFLCCTVACRTLQESPPHAGQEGSSPQLFLVSGQQPVIRARLLLNREVPFLTVMTIGSVRVDQTKGSSSPAICFTQ